MVTVQGVIVFIIIVVTLGVCVVRLYRFFRSGKGGCEGCSLSGSCKYYKKRLSDGFEGHVERFDGVG